MDNQIIPPVSLPSPMTEAPVDPEQAAAELKDKEVGSIVHHPGWYHLEAYLKSRVESLGTMRGADFDGQSLEDIGRKFLVARMVADELEMVLTWVKTTAEHVTKDADGTGED